MAEVLWQMKLSPKKVMSLETNYFIKVRVKKAVSPSSSSGLNKSPSSSSLNSSTTGLLQR